LQRRLERDVKERGRTRESVYAQWQGTVHPMHERFCEPSRVFADTIIENCGGSDAAVEQLWSELWSEATRRSGT
jgi:uridine kinase